MTTAQYLAEFTPEEIFNMFFGGGYPTGHLNRRHRGAQYHFHQQHSAQQEQVLFPIDVLHLKVFFRNCVFLNLLGYFVERTIIA